MGFALGDAYARDGLNLDERELVTIISLFTAGGYEPQLEVHIDGALNVGIPLEELIETFPPVHLLHRFSQGVRYREHGKKRPFPNGSLCGTPKSGILCMRLPDLLSCFS